MMSRTITLLIALFAVLALTAPAEASRDLLQATPAPDEGVDGQKEGMGEGATPATPAVDEGVDGALEGMGEGETVPAADEGEDGIFEGGGEGTTAEGTSSPDEGADGTFEGQGENQEASAVAPIAMNMGAVAAAAAAIILM